MPLTKGDGPAAYGFQVQTGHSNAVSALPILLENLHHFLTYQLQMCQAAPASLLEGSLQGPEATLPS